jgi:hypothetical protein
MVPRTHVRLRDTDVKSLGRAELERHRCDRGKRDR